MQMMYLKNWFKKANLLWMRWDLKENHGIKFIKICILISAINNLLYIPPTIIYDKLKKEKIIRDEDGRLKEQQRNQRIQAYLQFKPQNLTNYSVLPKPIYESSKLESVNLAINQWYVFINLWLEVFL